MITATPTVLGDSRTEAARRGARCASWAPPSGRLFSLVRGRRSGFATCSCNLGSCFAIEMRRRPWASISDAQGGLEELDLRAILFDVPGTPWFLFCSSFARLPRGKDARLPHLVSNPPFVTATTRARRRMGSTSTLAEKTAPRSARANGGTIFARHPPSGVYYALSACHPSMSCPRGVDIMALSHPPSFPRERGAETPHAWRWGRCPALAAREWNFLHRMHPQ